MSASCEHNLHCRIAKKSIKASEYCAKDFSSVKKAQKVLHDYDYLAAIRALKALP